MCEQCGFPLFNSALFIVVPVIGHAEDIDFAEMIGCVFDSLLRWKFRNFDLVVFPIVGDFSAGGLSHHNQFFDCRKSYGIEL